MPRTPRTFFRSTAVTWWLAAIAACAPASDTGPRADLDHAVARFIAGDYAATIEEMERVAAAADDESVRREAYTYIGRSHMALGHTEEAIDAFSRGARYGDRGPCVAYLELLKQYVEGTPGTLHTRETITRGELAGAIVRLMGGAESGKEPGPTGPTPLQAAAARGWIPASPDGDEHADLAVTRAALYVVVARLLAEVNSAGRAGEVMPGGYRVATAATDPVSGAEAITILERVRAIRESHGR
jgi:hypothetical protein